VRLTVRDLERVPHREFLRREILARQAATGVSTDSRTTRSGDLFVALRGPTYDGHRFAGQAFAAGAVAAVVDEEFDITQLPGKPLLRVLDTTFALGAVARLYRDRFSIPFLAVGGSNGKTTTKEMIASVLREKYNVLSTEGNLNNRIGVPMTLFRLSRKHEVAVIEIGTNHPGEIAHLCGILGPTHGVITNIGREHLEFFGSVEGVAGEEGALFDALSGGGGKALVGVDDPRIRIAAREVHRKVTYGFRSRAASVRGRGITLDGEGRASFEFRSGSMKRWYRVRLALPGKHNAMNALSAAAAGVVFHVPPLRISQALESCRAVSSRMETLSVGGVTILNDTYNANPDSALVALETLVSLRGNGKRVAVLADMKELGAAGAASHAALGREAFSLGISHLLTLGELAGQIHTASGIPGARHFTEKQELAEYLAGLLAPGDAVLVKGSRGMHMEEVVDILKKRMADA